VVTPLLDFPVLDDVPDRESQALRAHAWSATEYLLDRYGADGLRGLCAAWDAPETGATSSSNDFSRSAFQEALGLSPEQFESDWRADRLALLRADAEALQATIATRVEAVRNGDETGFLSTVTSADPVLRTEERNWFADLADHSVVTYSVTGELVGWSQSRGQRPATEAVVAGGLTPIVDLIFGLPGEETEDVAATLRLMEDLVAMGAVLHTHTFMPLPGTPLESAPPGRVDPALHPILDRLASQGQAARTGTRSNRLRSQGDSNRNSISLTLPIVQTRSRAGTLPRVPVVARCRSSPDPR